MLSSRGPSGQSSALRKSRMEGKPSLLPKPRRPGSIDRQSTDRRPSNAGHRSSSAEPPRATFGGRLSREASATKLPINRRSRSQQGDKYGQSSITPLRPSHYRPTATPVRTPSEERGARSWQTSLERALAFVTLKDQRQISNVVWLRSEFARVQEGLAARGGTGTNMALIRPLTIARFVEITGALLSAITRDNKLNTDNYVAKLQGVSKRLLYPGAVSKSWLKTVNTLHAFPHALALVSYLLDMANHIELPVSDEWLYIDKGELARLRRDYLYKCWIRFQDPGAEFDDLNEEYLFNLKELLGDSEEKVMTIQQDIKSLEARLEDESEAAAREDEARRAARYEALQGTLRSARAGRAAARARADAARAAAADRRDRRAQLEREIQRAEVENQQLKAELERQTMSVAERSRLLDEVDYAARVQDSKRTFAEELAKMVTHKENELAVWQKKTLDACVQYRQGLIRAAAGLPDLARLAVDEKELMSAMCGARVAAAVESLRETAAALAERRARTARDRTARARQRRTKLDEARAKIEETKEAIQRSQEALDSEAEREAAEAAAFGAELRDVTARREQLERAREAHERLASDLGFWEAQLAAWQTKLGEMNDYISKLRVETEQRYEAERAKRVALVLDAVRKLKEKHLMPAQTS